MVPSVCVVEHHMRSRTGPDSEEPDGDAGVELAVEVNRVRVPHPDDKV